MQYYKIDLGKFIEFDESTNYAKTIIKEDLVTQKKALQARIAENPQPTDKELLEWAKQNYPYVDHSVEQEELVKVTAVLDTIKAL